MACGVAAAWAAAAGVLSGLKCSAVFEADLMPKYAVVIVPIAVKALVRMATIGEPLAEPPEAFTTPQIAARTITASPPITTHRPVQARVRWTELSVGLLPRLSG